MSDGNGKPPVASAVIVQDGRLLLARRREQEGTVLWALPGGAVEPRENAEQAAVRFLGGPCTVAPRDHVVRAPQHAVGEGLKETPLRLRLR